MWNETNFLLKGFVDEVKGALAKGSSSGSGGIGCAAMAFAVGYSDEVYAGVCITTGSTIV